MSLIKQKSSKNQKINKMNKILNLIILNIFLSSCSFDNKSGIWTGSEQIVKQQNNNQNIELIFKKKNNFIEDKELQPNQKFNFDAPISYKNWTQSYQNKSNNINNLSFYNEGNYKRLSKVSSSVINSNILVFEKKLFFSDNKGNIGIFSLDKNQLIFKFNFYKKRLKNAGKNIKIILKGNQIIAADNFGYIYSIDYKKNKVIWAKNFLIPFRSNLKIINEVIFLSDEKNKIILIDVKTGNKIDELYTQPSKTVSKFESNLAIDNKNNLLFLSTSGSLYSINFINNKKINWIQNFKSESEIVFDGKPIIVSDNEILISTGDNISLLSSNGARIWDLKIKSSISPIISGNTILTVNNDNYLVLIDKETGQILFSKNINLMIAKNFEKNIQKKIKQINYIFLINGKLLLISNNSYFIELMIENKINLNSIKKNPFVISSDIIFLESEMLFTGKSNRIYRVN